MQKDQDAARPLSMRERGKQDRRTRILDAAEALIRETAESNFTIAQLAERAALSGPTPFNLFGSKRAILYALLNRSLDPIIHGETRTQPPRDPIDRVLAAAALGAEVFTQDPAFYRPLYKVLLGVGDTVYRPAFLEFSCDYWRRVLLPLVRSGQLPRATTGNQLARFFVLNFMSSLELWVHGDLDHQQFRAQILYGTSLALLGYANERQRALLQRRMAKYEVELPAGFSATLSG